MCILLPFLFINFFFYSSKSEKYGNPPSSLHRCISLDLMWLTVLLGYSSNLYSALRPVISLLWDAAMLRLMLLRPLPKHRGRARRQLSRLVIWWTEDFPVSVSYCRFRFSVAAFVLPPRGAQLSGNGVVCTFFMKALLPSVWVLGLRGSTSEGPSPAVKGILIPWHMAFVV